MTENYPTPLAKRTAERKHRATEHRQLSGAGVPRKKDGNRLGLRKRRDLFDAAVLAAGNAKVA